MGVKVIFKDVDFSANSITLEYVGVPAETDWAGWLCNYEPNRTAQQNASWNTAFYPIPEGVTKVYLSGYIAAGYGVSLVSDYNTASHVYTNVAPNIVLGSTSSATEITRQELDISAYPNAKYVMWCRIASTGVPEVEILE